MAPKLKDGLPLIVGGLPAVSEDCCCDPPVETCGGCMTETAPLSLTVTLSDPCGGCMTETAPLSLTVTLSDPCGEADTETAGTTGCTDAGCQFVEGEFELAFTSEDTDDDCCWGFEREDTPGADIPCVNPYLPE